MRGVYTVSFQGVAISAAQDLFGLYAGASRKLEVHSAEIGAATGSIIQNPLIRLRRLPINVTAGSGGNSFTPVKTDPLDAAAGFTARINDTAPASSSGTILDVHPTVVNTTNGWIFQWTERTRPRCDLNEALVLKLDSTLASIVLSGVIYVEER